MIPISLSISEFIFAVQTLIDQKGLSQDTLDRIGASLAGLARNKTLWDSASFPALEPGEMQRRYLVADDGSAGISLYLMMMRRGKRTPIHNHSTWACIAAIEGTETNYLYDWKGQAGSSGRAMTEVDLGPGKHLAFGPQDTHAVEIKRSDTILHLHLYGRPLEGLHARRTFNEDGVEQGEMFVLTPTLVPNQSKGWGHRGDMNIRGTKWGYFDSRTPGEVFLLLPGVSSYYEHLAPLIHELAKRHRVIGISYGAADSAAAMAESIRDLLAALDVRPARIYGTSFGGYIAQWLVCMLDGPPAQLCLANSFSDPGVIASVDRSVLDAGLTTVAFLDRMRAAIEAIPLAGMRKRKKHMMLFQHPDALLARARILALGVRAPDIALPADRVTILDAVDDAVLDAKVRGELPARYPAVRRVSLPFGGHDPYNSNLPGVLQALGLAHDQ